ncbi:hypothetical protein I7I53_08185 [Histoplasma capsulatum var. duboisii H88]|uniref:Uncharacterized protein n=1 Tax=Ajellomyces capsulatus (strain H88) TaxID=544711 RepID=A0A8A1LEN2_AJEC8|nr:hypothetical protein I7I53_08185 [Histoplasma capsulatum var. duboisii H88]
MGVERKPFEPSQSQVSSPIISTVGIILSSGVEIFHLYLCYSAPLAVNPISFLEPMEQFSARV